MTSSEKRAIEIQAHRGGRGVMPENTLAAFDHALSLGVDVLELDVGVTCDGVVVVYHDRELNPDITRDRHGRWLMQTGPTIFCSSYETLGEFDVGRLKPGTAYQRAFPQQRALNGQVIPTLDQVIALLRRRGAEEVGLNVELKLSPLEPDATLDYERFAQSVVDVLQRAALAARCTIQAFDWRPLQYIQRVAPEILTGYLSCRQPTFDTVGSDPGLASVWHAGYRLADHAHSLPAMIKAAGGAYWGPHFENLDVQQLREAHALGLQVKAWTVNEVEDARRLIGMGVDALISDYPERMRTLLLKLGLPAPDPVPVTT